VPSVTADYYTQTRTGGEIEARYTAMGEYDVTYAEYPARDMLIKRYEIWYPSDLAQEDREWPVVVRANGTGVPATRYAPVFRHLASWGFVVIGNEMQNSWSGEASAGALDLLAELNEDPSSPFFQKLDLDNVGSAGHSQGAIGAINAVTSQPNGDSYKALYLASTPSSLYSATLDWAYDPALIDIPCFMAAGARLLDAGEPGSPEASQAPREVSLSPTWTPAGTHRPPRVSPCRAGLPHLAPVVPGGKLQPDPRGGAQTAGPAPRRRPRRDAALAGRLHHRLVHVLAAGGPDGGPGLLRAGGRDPAQ